MSAFHRYKVWGFALALLAALYVLVPSFLGLKEKRAEAVKSGQSLPAWMSWLPDQELNLGLDLRGGLYMELGVEMSEAVEHQLGFLAGDVKRYVLDDDAFEGSDVERVAGEALRLTLPADKKALFDTELVKLFGNEYWLVSRESSDVFFKVSGDAPAFRKAVLKQLEAVSNFQGQADLVLDKKYVAVSFVNDSARESFLTLLQNQTALQAESQAPQGLYAMQLTDLQKANLRRNIVEQAANSVRNRIDRFGVAEASVSRQGSDRLVVELPGVKDPDQIINLIRRTGQLEFRVVDGTLSGAALRGIVNKAAQDLGTDRPYEQDQIAKLNQKILAELPENTEVVFELTRSSEDNKVTSYRPYLLKKDAPLTGDMLDNASVQTDRNLPVVSMSFNKSGAKAFGDLTAQNVGKQLAIVLDDVVMSAPNIDEPIYGGSAIIRLGFGRYEDLQREAQDLVLILKEGALPASLKVDTKNIIGPSLGQASIEAGTQSLLIAAAVVLLFMVVYYKVGGIVANIALIVNVLFIFALLTLFGASLTLPGIAGIVLTLGMAVDANVIIFERMREEQHLGKSLQEVIDSGYGHAMSAILDGNITTFIAGLVLFEFGTGPIKGFATTLMIGIASSLLTAIVLTRVIYDSLVAGQKMKRLVI